MQNNINYGIDLGTTNSAIGVYQDGKVIILKNPKGFRELLPSAIAYKNGRTIVGDKALELIEQTPEMVITSFKRNMGTNKVYQLDEGNISITPIELSAQILSTLFTFERDNTIQSCVITIPASFDTAQSNATKKAGKLAGLTEVLLLQEPIAACLAYANENKIDLNEKQSWVVYDFGGGTFDCALVTINNRELKTVNHLGNNFLGGFDIDQAVLKNVVLPKLEQNITNQLTSEQLETLSLYLLAKIEEAKKELSVSNSALIEIEYDDINLYCELSVNLDEFNQQVKPFFDESITLLQEMLQQSGVNYSDLNRIILVGGTTYIPYIRENLKNITGVIVDSSIDPTTAVVKGAAFYAGTKISLESPKEDKVDNKINVSIQFENNTRDDEELIDIKTEKDFNGFIQIERINDKYKEPNQPFKNHIQVFVPLIANTLNVFKIILLNSSNKIVYEYDIAINQGGYSINGQPLPSDICLEVDGNESKETFLEPIFFKNSLLPLRKTVFKTLSKTVMAGSDDDVFINVVEGKRGTMPASNLSVGIINIKGSMLQHDLVKGTPIELDISISESRDLEVTVKIPSAEMTLKSVFNPHIKWVNKDKFIIELNNALGQVSPEINKALQEQNFDLASKYQKLSDKLISLLEDLKNVNTDNIYKLDEQKRSLLKSLDDLDRATKLQNTIEKWNLVKNEIMAIQDKLSLNQRETMEGILADEKEMLNSGDRHWINNKILTLKEIVDTIFFSDPKNFGVIFLSIKTLPDDSFVTDVKLLKEKGEVAMMSNNYEMLMSICHSLMMQLKPEVSQRSILPIQNITGIR